MSEFDVYLITLLDNVNVLLGVSLMIDGFLILWLWFAADYYKDHRDRIGKLLYKTALRRLKIAIGMLILLAIALVLTPTTSQICAIKIVPMLINNKQVKADMREVYTLGMDYVRDILKQGDK